MNFSGTRAVNGIVVFINDKNDLLDPWGKIPEYNWGFIGLGPLNLGRAILFNVFGGKIAFRYDILFVRKVISKLDFNNFNITSTRVKQWVSLQLNFDHRARRRELYKLKKMESSNG